MNTPTFLYGTAWKEDDTERCVRDAVEAGFRGIDTANQRKHYFEAGVGQALKKIWADGKLKREDFFLQTKYTFVRGQDHRLPYDPKAPLEKQVEQSFQSSLEHLHTDYLDSYVLHGPATYPGLIGEDWEVWGAMENLQNSGRVRRLGLSNVALDQLQEFYEKGSVKPAFVQNRCFARTGWDYAVRTYCRERGIVYQGFSLLTANPEVFRNPRFHEVIERVGCTPAQAVFRFAVQVGMLPLTGTTDRAHMREDLDALDPAFELSKEDLQTIEEISL